MKAKVDTGARSSALHAVDIETFRRRGRAWARFEVHPTQRSHAGALICEVPLLEHRKVKSSNGKLEERVFLVVDAELGGQSWPIELSLTSRANMGFRVLLGREATRRRFLVDPGRSYQMGRPDGSVKKLARGGTPK